MKQIELLAPAGSAEGVRAAVQSGADAVYLGFGSFHARRGAKNLTRDELAGAIEYCRVRGVLTNIALNIVTFDRERKAALDDARFLYEAGADAVIVQDLGLAQAIRQHVPDLPLHASTQLTVNTVEGARFAAQMGFSRVVLARECNLAQIREITAEGGVETEVFVHGALCMCYSGQCYLSAVIGQRSGNRGMCAQPCRLAYTYDTGKRGYPLSLKDLSLAEWLGELEQAGVSSLKIEGRMKRPEYAAIVTRIYADLLKEQRRPTREEQLILQKVFSRDGFTDGYLTGRKGDGMFGTKTDVPYSELNDLYMEAAKRFAPGHEEPIVPVVLSFHATEQGVGLRVTDEDGHQAAAQHDEPVEAALTRATTEEEVEAALRKTGGTPFDVRRVRIKLDPGLMVPVSRINALRRSALDTLLGMRRAAPSRAPWREVELPPVPNRSERLAGCIVETRTLLQVTDALLEAKPAALYVPLLSLAENMARTKELSGRLPVAAVLPRIYTDTEWPALRALLITVRAAGVGGAVVGNVGQIAPVRALEMAAIGDFGLNATNSGTLAALASAGVCRQTLSFELRLAQIRDLQKPIETELLIYGYLPLMYFENNVIRRKANGKLSAAASDEPCLLRDRTGRAFRVMPEYGGRSSLLNSQPLFLDKPEEYEETGVKYVRLRFTTETPERCAEIVRAVTAGETPEFPQGVTRGLYYRGVE